MKKFMTRDKETDNGYLEQLKGKREMICESKSIHQSNSIELTSTYRPNEENILNDVSTRNKMLNNEFVMMKVKKIMMLSHLNYCNVKMVAEYFEVSHKTIQTVIDRNKQELLQNGMKIVSGPQLKEIIKDIFDNLHDVILNMKTTLIAQQFGFIYDNQTFANNSNTILNRRSILNIAMLLRDSVIAQKIRKE